MPPGKPRTPKNKLKMSGSWLADKRPDAPRSTVQPGAPPDDLDDISKDLWLTTLASAPWISESDEPFLVAYCVTRAQWQRNREAMEMMMPGTIEHKRVAAIVLQLGSAWERAASKLGLSPVDRNHVEVPSPVSEGIDELLERAVKAKRCKQ